MTQEVDVVVAVGGKLHVETGFNQGVLEELAQARWHNVPCFVVGAFGGAAGQLDNALIDELNAGNLMDDKSSMEMATLSYGMDEYVGKLIGHMARHRDDLRGRLRGVAAFQFSRKSMLEAHAANIVSVDPEVVGAWSARFGELMKHVEGKDVASAGSLLRSTEF
jgi:hypothetical protein